MNNPRLLALLPFLYKGALSIEIFRALVARGFDITVAYCEDISARSPCDDMADFRAADRLVDLSGYSMPKCSAVIAQILESHAIDLIVQVGAHELYHHLPYWKEAHPRLRIVDILYNEVGHTLNHFLYEASIDAVIVESEFMAAYVRRASRKHYPCAEVVHSGIDLQAFTPQIAPATCPRPLTLGFLGRMSAEKNPLGFIELAERLLIRHPDVRFRLYGVGPDADLVRRRLDHSPHRASIEYGGFVAEQHTALQEFDALILPSRLDGRPVVIMEANGCGVPVLGAPVGGVPELIDEGINGHLVNPHDVEAFDALLTRWKAEPASLQQLRRSARAYAVARFDHQRMFHDYAVAFRRIAARGGAADGERIPRATAEPSAPPTAMPDAHAPAAPA